MEEFATIACTPFHVSDALSETAMSFVSRLYSDTPTSDVDVVRMNVFCQKTRDHWRIQRGGCGGCNPPLNFQKRAVTSTAVVIDLVATSC